MPDQAELVNASGRCQQHAIISALLCILVRSPAGDRPSSPTTPPVAQTVSAPLPLAQLDTPCRPKALTSVRINYICAVDFRCDYRGAY